MPNFKKSNGFKMKGFSQHQTSGLKAKSDDKLKKQGKDPYTKKDYDFLKEQREERVKSTDYLEKLPTGPRATKKKVKDDPRPLSPGYEDPIKIQKVQREGITPHSQKFSKKARAKTQTVPKPKKSTTTKHGQLNDAEAEYKTDKKLYEKSKKKSPNKKKDLPKEHKTTGYTPPPAGSQKEKAQHTREGRSVGRRYSRGYHEVMEKRGMEMYGRPDKKTKSSKKKSPNKSVTDSVNRGNTDVKKVKVIKEKNTIDVKDDKGKVVVKNLPRNKKIEELQKNQKKHTLKDKTQENIKRIKANAHPFVKTISGFVDSIKGAKTGQNKA